MVKKYNISDKLVKKYQQNKFFKRPLLSTQSRFVLDGIWKKHYESFLGVPLPLVIIHNKTLKSLYQTKKYHALSYAQGSNIYIGSNAKALDTLEGKALLAHELTHVLQQKYLDMSSAKDNMVDPSIELENRAKVVESRVYENRGIEKSNRDYFKKWNILPQRSYSPSHKIVQRINKNIIFDIAKGAQKHGIPMKTGNILYDATDVNPIKMGIGAVGGLVDNVTDYKYHDSIEKSATQLGNIVDISKKIKTFVGIPNLKNRNIFPSLLEEGKYVYKSLNPKKIEQDLEEQQRYKKDSPISKETLENMERDNDSLQQAILEGKFPVSKKYIDDRREFTKIKKLTRTGRFESKLFNWDKNSEYKQVKNLKKPNYKSEKPYKNKEVLSREYLNFIHPPRFINSRVTKKYEVPIQRVSLKGVWNSTKNLGNAVYHSVGTAVDGANSVVKATAGFTTQALSGGADLFGYKQKAKFLNTISHNLKSSASNDLNDATKHFAKSTKYKANFIGQLVNDKNLFSQQNIDNTVGARDLHYGRNKHNKKLLSESEAISLKWKRLSVEKSLYHRMGEGNENNVKYVDPKGESEAVFYGKDGVGKKGTPINSVENEATYNYFSPYGISAMGHVVTDVLPYYVWGNSKQDSTSFFERITASYNGKNNPIQRKILNKYQYPIQRKILNKYQYPIQRWSLSGTLSSATNAMSNVKNSVVGGVQLARKSVGKIVHNTGTKIANKWNNSSVGKTVNRYANIIGNDISKHGKDYLNIGLNSLSAIGKIGAGVATVVGTGLFTGGAGFVAGGTMIAGGLTDVNKAVKGIHKSYLKHNGQSDKEAEKNRQGILGFVGLKSAEKFSENNKYMQMGSSLLDVTSGVLSAGTALHKAGGFFNSGRESLNYGQKSLSTINKKLALNMYKNPNRIKGITQVAKNSIWSGRWNYLKGFKEIGSGIYGSISNPIKHVNKMINIENANSPIQRKIDNRYNFSIQRKREPKKVVLNMEPSMKDYWEGFKEEFTLNNLFNKDLPNAGNAIHTIASESLKTIIPHTKNIFTHGKSAYNSFRDGNYKQGLLNSVTTASYMLTTPWTLTQSALLGSEKALNDSAVENNLASKKQGSSFHKAFELGTDVYSISKDVAKLKTPLSKLKSYNSLAHTANKLAPKKYEEENILTNKEKNYDNMIHISNKFVPKIDEKEKDIKYAKENRESSKIGTSSMAFGIKKNRENLNYNLDELSIRIYRQLKSEIAIEYVRRG